MPPGAERLERTGYEKSTALVYPENCSLYCFYCLFFLLCVCVPVRERENVCVCVLVCVVCNHICMCVGTHVFGCVCTWIALLTQHLHDLEDLNSEPHPHSKYFNP